MSQHDLVSAWNHAEDVVAVSPLTNNVCTTHDNFSFNSLGPKFSSQGHFHSLQPLNVPQFLFLLKRILTN